MNTSITSQIASAWNISGEAWAAIGGVATAALVLAKKLVSRKAAKPELVTRVEFSAEMLASRQHMHADHLALLEKLDANHRDLLSALERQGTRINTLEAGLARVDERTKI
jgi:hypothetical protein